MSGDVPRGFYVGYLPLPRAHKRALRIAIPALVLIILVSGGVIAALQRDPGPAVWDTAAQRTWTGVVIAHPYPMLLDQESGQLLPVVEMGKIGSQQRFASHDAAMTEVTGFALTRGGRRLIEAAPTPSGFWFDPDRSPPPLVISPDPITLQGEILDAKCYLGAMKPGDGRAHKACAELCIAGGIPPMLFTRDGGGRGGARPRHFIIADAQGRSARDLVLGFLGEPITITGRTATLAGQDFILIGDGAITRAP